MTIAEVLLQDFDVEMAGARRLLERVPDDKADYKPHEKSFNLGKLAMHVATLPFFGKMILSTPGMNMKEQSFPDNTFRSQKALLETFETSSRECRAALASLSDEQLQQPWRFAFGDHVISESPRALTYKTAFFNHFLHHRGQVVVYLRLNNIPVPGLYGPSADEPFAPK